MTIEVITEFLRLATVRVRASIYDDDGALVNPTTSITIDIWDSEGTKQEDGTAMDSVSTGIYEFFYNLAADSVAGNWRGIVWVVDGTKTSEFSFGFKVKV